MGIGLEMCYNYELREKGRICYQTAIQGLSQEALLQKVSKNVERNVLILPCNLPHFLLE